MIKHTRASTNEQEARCALDVRWTVETRDGAPLASLGLAFVLFTLLLFFISLRELFSLHSRIHTSLYTYTLYTIVTHVANWTHAISCSCSSCSMHAPSKDFGTWGKAPPCTVPPLLYTYCVPTIMNTRRPSRMRVLAPCPPESQWAFDTEPSD